MQHSPACAPLDAPRGLGQRDRSPARSPRTIWPWLLAAGPVLVVVASLVTAWLAVTHGDRVVAEDYYRLGLTINRRLAAEPAATGNPRATLVIARDGTVRVHLEGTDADPAQLRLSLRHPGQREAAHTATLEHAGDDEWRGMLADLSPGRRIVALESEAWRLPVTVVDAVPATVRLGALGSESDSPASGRAR